MKSYQAEVEVLLGNRVVSDFMASAGLGLTGVGCKSVMTIDYKPGEEVDEARVAKVMDVLIEESNREGLPTKILSYKVLSVAPVERGVGL